MDFISEAQQQLFERVANKLDEKAKETEQIPRSHFDGYLRRAEKLPGKEVVIKGTKQLHSYEVTVLVDGKMQIIVVNNQPDARSAEKEVERLLTSR